MNCFCGSENDSLSEKRDAVHSDDHTKEDNKLIQVIENARQLYIKKGLVGSVSVTRSLFFFYRSVSCDIDGIADRSKLPKGEAVGTTHTSSHEGKGKELETESVAATEQSEAEFIPGTGEVDNSYELTNFEKVAVAAVKRCIGSLERRAKLYKRKRYDSKLTLTNTVYVTVPCLEICSISVTCAATAESLNAAAEAADADDAEDTRKKSEDALRL